MAEPQVNMYARMNYLRSTLWIAFLLISCHSLTLMGQTSLPFVPISLDDLSGFKPAAANWKIAGDVIVDRSADGIVQSFSGKGIIVNQPTDKNKDQLFTSFEHGNIELELEFMMAKGSNSGIYLQGRYEIQLFDSWGVARPRSSDCGSIYERWDESRPEGQKGYEGHPPRVNVSRAPGLWQTMKIVFQAPTFDKNGKKLTSARFIKVMHNGVVVHENVEVTGPTRASAFQDEKPFGPLMLQGDHGPVAFRNIRYKRYDEPFVQLSQVQYKYSEGKMYAEADIAKAKVKKQGAVEEHMQLIEGANDFALQLTGTLQVPSMGNYLFELKCMGGAILIIDGKKIITYEGFHYPDEWTNGVITLQAGNHTFALTYFRSKDPWLRSEMSLYVEGPGVARQMLSLPTSLPDPEYVEPIVVRAPETRMIRSFIWHNNRKKTNAISVGEPGNIHYTMDLKQGGLLWIWKGNFLDATEMWHDRGEPQLAKPAGSVIEMTGEPSVAVLSGKDAIWPDSVSADFQFKGYAVDEQGRPAFRYTIGNLAVQDQLWPEDNNKAFVRQVQLKGSANGSVWYLLASGSRISQLSEGVYSVNDKAYYLEVEGARELKPVIRKSKNREELLIPVSLTSNGTTIKSKLIW